MVKFDYAQLKIDDKFESGGENSTKLDIIQLNTEVLRCLCKFRQYLTYLLFICNLDTIFKFFGKSYS